MSKGSTRRKPQIPEDKVKEQWEKIFQKKRDKKKK
tara:strand:+ start:72 stop:176 length:105 start_codon:yes stop_codon:yes gene_type:complete